MPQLSFIYPEMLWLLGALALIWALALLAPRRLPPWRFWGGLALRSAIGISLVLAVAGAQLVLPVDRLTTVFLLDGSDSLAPSLRAQAESFIQEALAAMPEGDRAAIVVFGGNALVERAPSDQRRLGRISSVPVATRTNIADAIQLGLALLPADTEKRLVLLSDGAENSGQAAEAARIAAARRVPISVVNLALPSDDAEALVAQLEAPARVRDGQVARLRASIESTIAQRATVRLIGDGGVLAERQVDLQPGANLVPFEVPVSGAGFQRYRVQVQPARDGRAQNNEASALIQVQGPPRVLVVAPRPEESAALVSALAATNVLAEPVAPDSALMPADLASLSVYDAVILVNVPARALPVGAMAALPAYVRDLGKGLLMVGGDQSFGVGGYGHTPVEEAMPVYMDVRNREERPDLAIIYVIDKSGSMDACHCSSPDRGSAQLSTGGARKVDIAKQAVAEAAALLGPRDHLGITTFDGQAFQTLPVTQGATVDQVISAVAGVQPSGSTNVRAGLLEAQDMLAGVDARIKHVILLTDGWGGGGDQSDIAQGMRGQGITLSVVAAGGGSASYLERLAQEGGGRYYAAQDMADVPQIFVQETIAAVGNYIIERPFTPAAVGSSPLLAGISSTPTLYGFNGSTLKESARLAMATDDGEPLLATWQYGLGRSAAWLSDAKGKWAKDWLRWADFPRFAGQMLGAVLPVRGGQEVGVDVAVSGGETTLRLDAGALAAPDLKVTATLISGGGGPNIELPLSQIGPGSYQGRVASPAPGTYLVQISGAQGQRAVLQETAGLVVPYSSEYRSSQGNPALLSALAALTGGQLISAAAEAFARPDARVTTASEIGLPLTILALLLLPLDIALRRLMLRRGDLGAAGGWLAARRAARAAAAPAPAPTAADETMGRLAEAKRRAAARIGGAPQPPAATAPPADPEDPMQRLRAARDRARRRASGDDG